MKYRSCSPQIGAESRLQMRKLGLSRELMPRVILRKPIAAELDSHLKLLSLLRSDKRCWNFHNFKSAVGLVLPYGLRKILMCCQSLLNLKKFLLAL